MTITAKTIIATLAASAALALTAGTAFAEHFTGTWKVQDTDGKPFEIMIEKGGSASSQHEGKAMKGKWTEKDGAVTITWDTGWTTKIAKHGSGYTKTATEGGKEKGSATPAEKVK